MRILIAEDDPVSRRLLEVTLKKWGHELAVASNGDEAWECLQEDAPPRLAILDWMMPGVDGAELSRRVRNSPRLKASYLIMLTAKGQKEDMLQGFEAGVDDYLTKPLDVRELSARVEVGKRVLELERQLEQRAETAEQRYRQIFANAVEGIFQLDVKGDLLTVNPAMAEILGYESPQQMVESVPNFRQMFASPGDCCNREGEDPCGGPPVKGFETRLRKKDGELVWVSINRRVVCGEEGKPRYIEGSIQDISSRKKHQKLFMNVITNTSHLINTPLTIALGQMDLVSMGLKEMTPELAATINTKLYEIRTLVVEELAKNIALLTAETSDGWTPVKKEKSS